MLFVNLLTYNDILIGSFAELSLYFELLRGLRMISSTLWLCQIVNAKRFVNCK